MFGAMEHQGLLIVFVTVHWQRLPNLLQPVTFCKSVLIHRTLNLRSSINT